MRVRGGIALAVLLSPSACRPAPAASAVVDAGKAAVDAGGTAVDAGGTAVDAGVHDAPAAQLSNADALDDHAPRWVDSMGPVKFVGLITDLGFACWSDRGPCAIKVDDRWVAFPHYFPGAPATRSPPGQAIGISIAGGNAEELRQRYLGKRVEVFAARTSDPFATTPRWNDRALSIASAPYYVKLLDAGK